MFNKPFKIKQNSLLKGSEIRKTRSEILKSFPLLEEDELLGLMPQKGMIASTKLVTHSGESVTVFSVEKLPIVFVVENVFYPTVYMLWRFPDLLPVFTTWFEVLTKLRGGADLMLPGIVLRREVRLHAYGKLDKGARVAINSTNNKAPAAVGVTALSSVDMYMAAKRGKAVNIHHIIGDHLWALGATLTIPELGPPWETPISTRNPTEFGCTSVSGNVEEVVKTHLVQPLEDVKVSGESEKSQLADKDESIKEMDELLLYCFLKAWKTPAKKSEFPILSSNFYRLHILPACPVGKTLDLKKSSYKKVSKFLSAMQNTGIITLQELTKGVESIMSVDYAHSMLKEFVDINTSAETENKKEDISKKHLKPEIIEMRTVTAAVLPVFSRFGHKKGDSLPVADIRKIVTRYVKDNSLQRSSDKSMVNLDPLLKTLLQRPEADSLKWGDLMSTFLDRMSHSYQISYAGESSGTSKGRLKTIDMQVERRTANKKVTLVNNLEIYNIDIHAFARECQHGAAASTSVNTLPGPNSRQLLVQGNQVLFVAKLLTQKYNIPKHYITGLQHAPKK